MAKMKEYKFEMENLQFQDAVEEMMNEDKELFMELNDNYTMTKEEEQRAMKEIFDELDKQERIAVIDYYISIIVLSSIAFLFGLLVGFLL